MLLNHLRIVITINFLHVHNKIMGNLAKANPILQKIKRNGAMRSNDIVQTYAEVK